MHCHFTTKSSPSDTLFQIHIKWGSQTSCRGSLRWLHKFVLTFLKRVQKMCVPSCLASSVIETVRGWRPTWNFSSVSPSPMWRSRSPLACPMLPAAVSTVCLGCMGMTSSHSLHRLGLLSQRLPWIIQTEFRIKKIIPVKPSVIHLCWDTD